MVIFRLDSVKNDHFTFFSWFYSYFLRQSPKQNIFSWTNRQTDGKTDTQSDGKTDSQTDRQTDRQTSVHNLELLDSANRPQKASLFAEFSLYMCSLNRTLTQLIPVTLRPSVSHNVPIISHMMPQVSELIG